MEVILGFGFGVLENPKNWFNFGNFGCFCLGLEDCADRGEVAPKDHLWSFLREWIYLFSYILYFETWNYFYISIYYVLRIYCEYINICGFVFSWKWNCLTLWKFYKLFEYIFSWKFNVNIGVFDLLENLYLCIWYFKRKFFISVDL